MMMNDDMDMKKKVMQEIMDLMDQHEGEGLKKPKVLEASIEVKKDPMAMMDGKDQEASEGMPDPDQKEDDMEMAKGLPDSDEPMDLSKIGDHDPLTPELIAKLVGALKK